jgi:single-strand DNA-binding protein
MAGLNKVLLIGNVGGDPEIRTLPSGSKVANFSIATSESYTDRTGQKQVQTEWHRIELWDSLANIAEQYVKKGDPIYIEGKIRTEKWTDQNGQERSGIRIRGLSMQLLGNNSRNMDESGSGNQNQAVNNTSMASSLPPTPQPSDSPAFSANVDDDLPF